MYSLYEIHYIHPIVSMQENNSFLIGNILNIIPQFQKAVANTMQHIQPSVYMCLISSHKSQHHSVYKYK